MSPLWIIFIIAGIAKLVDFALTKFQSAAQTESTIDDDITAHFDAEGNNIKSK